MRYFITFILSSFISLNAFSQNTQFIWPVIATNDYSEVTSFYTVNNYVDQDASGTFKDWKCLSKTYNGHTGIDIDLWPFSWSTKDNNYVAIVAAADGVVQTVQDQFTNDDSSINCTTGTCVNNCSSGTSINTNINRIIIRHADSTQTVYMHIKRNSRAVEVNDVVKAGQIIAYPGSSGPSTHPHLHFEVRKLINNNPNTFTIIDPFNSGLPQASNCNLLNTDSRWINQKPHDEPGIVRVMTHFGIPDLINDAAASNFCKIAENKKAKSDFNAGDYAYLGVALRDVTLNSSVTYTIYYPNGNLMLADFAIAANNYKKWYKTFGFPIPGNAPTGTYKVIANYAGTTGTHFFTVGCPASVIANNTVTYDGFIAGSLLLSTNVVNSGKRLRLQSAQTIKLQDGFRAYNGSTFKARIRDCNFSE